MSALGWIEGRNVVIESEGRKERAAEIAAEFARLKVDVIVHAEYASSSRGEAGNIGYPDHLPGVRRSSRRTMSAKNAAFLSAKWHDAHCGRSCAWEAAPNCRASTLKGRAAESSGRRVNPALARNVRRRLVQHAASA
jgi:hypothetical protein